MKLNKQAATFVHQVVPGPALKGACLLLPGPLHILPEHEELAKDLLACLPACVLCAACDDYLERLLNQRGVAVTRPLDPVEAIPDGAEVSLDLAAGTLAELASSRRFAVRALKPAHLLEISHHA